METNYMLISENQIDKSEHTVAVGLTKKAALQVLSTMLDSRDPNSLIDYKIRGYIPFQRLSFKGE